MTNFSRKPAKVDPDVYNQTWSQLHNWYQNLPGYVSLSSESGFDPLSWHSDYSQSDDSTNQSVQAAPVTTSTPNPTVLPAIPPSTPIAPTAPEGDASTIKGPVPPALPKRPKPTPGPLQGAPSWLKGLTLGMAVAAIRQGQRGNMVPLSVLNGIAQGAQQRRANRDAEQEAQYNDDWRRYQEQVTRNSEQVSRNDARQSLIDKKKNEDWQRATYEIEQNNNALNNNWIDRSQYNQKIQSIGQAYNIDTNRYLLPVDNSTNTTKGTEIVPNLPEQSHPKPSFKPPVNLASNAPLGMPQRTTGGNNYRMIG